MDRAGPSADTLPPESLCGRQMEARALGRRPLTFGKACQQLLPWFPKKRTKQSRSVSLGEAKGNSFHSKNKERKKSKIFRMAQRDMHKFLFVIKSKYTFP